MPFVRVGTVVRAVGLKGLLGVGGSDGGLALVSRVVLRQGGRDEELKVLEARPQGRLWVVQVEGISDRTAAEGRVRAEVLADREELGEAGEDQHYWSDLAGLRVVTVAGAELGTVTGLLETGGVDVLEVTGPAGEVLIPLAPYVTVELEAGRVVVDPPEGLLPGPGGDEAK
ncbi:MAG: 16S rRNA processing protein RimM [Anaeromyxobacter sp.]|nr:16S rRNA processing protein RimM [Anaeromyxobacter sp.]MBL0277683.1 16S rRNA processing protein RimM [Anaeromyxobacter sp.]